MSTVALERRLLTLESKYRTLRFLVIALAAISVALCGLVGYAIGSGGGRPQEGLVLSENGIASLELTRLSIKSPGGEERIRMDPGGLTIYGEKENHEQLRLEFGGLRFFNASGESAHFGSRELSFSDTEAGLRCSLDWRFLACTDVRSAGLSATFGILSEPRGPLDSPQTEVYSKMARTPHLSLTNVKEASSVDVFALASPAISVRSAGSASINVMDKDGKVVWRAPQ